MGVDQAFERFKALRAALPVSDDDRPITDNEACTRVHLIDPILLEVLGWPRNRVSVEAPGGESGTAATDRTNAREARLDYLVRDHENKLCFVIEAKKRSSPLVDPRLDGQGLEVRKLTGPVLRSSCWRIISQQMSPYLGRYMPHYGAVTNGEQWIGFLAKLRPDDLLLEHMNAIVFRSLDDIEHDFEKFYDLFGLEGVHRRVMARTLLPTKSRGFLNAPHARRVVPPGSERPIDYQAAPEFYEALKDAMALAFQAIRLDRDALAACFVESRESQDASTRLARIANELQQPLRDAVTHYPPAVGEEIDAISTSPPGVTVTTDPGDGYLARILGENSAGKTVFLHRFFHSELKQRDRALVLWLDVERLSPFDPKNASRTIFEQLNSALFGEEGPSWETLREIYRREWNQLLRANGISEGDADISIRKDFVQARIIDQQNDPLTAVARYAEFATKNRRRLVCLVVDNFDHLERPADVLEWVVAVHSSIYALTTVAMEDTTLWRLRRNGIDQLGDRQPEQFWLHRPKVREVLENRYAYLKRAIFASSQGLPRTQTPVGARGQYRWTVNPDDLVQAVSAVLLDNDKTAQWIGQLCNYDLRQVLDACRDVVLSPHVRAHELLSMKVIQKPSSPHRVLRALIAPKSQQFQAAPTVRVTNIFCQWLGNRFIPLLPIRLLAFLRAREDADRNRKETFTGFASVQELADLLESSASVPRDATINTVRKLATLELVDPYDLGDRELRQPQAKVKITPRGRLHLDWSLEEVTYVRLMAEVDPIVSESAYIELKDAWKAFLDSLSRKDGDYWAREQAVAAIYIDYLLNQAAEICPMEDGSNEIESIRKMEDVLRATWSRVLDKQFQQ